MPDDARDPARGRGGDPDPDLRSLAPAAVLVGAGLCVSCLAALAYGLTALLGVSLLPPLYLGADPRFLLLSGGLLVVAAVLGVRRWRQAKAAVERGEPPDPYWSFHPKRAAASLVLGALAVAVVASLSKLAIESLTGFTYVIHWATTVPILAVLFGWVVHGEWNRRVLEAADGEAPPASNP